MKEKKIEIDKKRGHLLLFRMLRLYPFSRFTNEHILNQKRSHRVRYIMDNFWLGTVKEIMDSKGYNPGFEFKYHRGYSLDEYKQDISAITENITRNLFNIEKKPKKDYYVVNRAFSIVRIFFQILFRCLSKHSDKGGWKKLTHDKEQEFVNEFHSLFGFLNYGLSELITTPEEFMELVNEILKELGFGDFSMNNDGVIRYFGATEEAEQKKRAYNVLGNKKFDNVVSELDNIEHHISNGKVSDALNSCRKALEAFYKRLLLNHNIQTLNNGTNTEDGTVDPLAQTIKTNISNLFDPPSYSKNLDTHGLPQLIESSKFIISGLANPGGSHGKSKPPKVSPQEVRIAESFLIMLINVLLPLEK